MCRFSAGMTTTNHDHIKIVLFHVKHLSLSDAKLRKNLAKHRFYIHTPDQRVKGGYRLPQLQGKYFRSLLATRKNLLSHGQPIPGTKERHSMAFMRCKRCVRHTIGQHPRNIRQKTINTVARDGGQPPPRQVGLGVIHKINGASHVSINQSISAVDQMHPKISLARPFLGAFYPDPFDGVDCIP